MLDVHFPRQKLRFPDFARLCLNEQTVRTFNEVQRFFFIFSPLSQTAHSEIEEETTICEDKAAAALNLYIFS